MRGERQAARSAAERGTGWLISAAIIVAHAPLYGRDTRPMPSRRHGPRPDTAAGVTNRRVDTHCRPSARRDAKASIEAVLGLHPGPRAAPALRAQALAAGIVTRQGRDAVLRLGEAKPSRARPAFAGPPCTSNRLDEHVVCVKVHMSSVSDHAPSRRQACAAIRIARSRSTVQPLWAAIRTASRYRSNERSACAERGPFRKQAEHSQS